jgi:hypothetical protein
MGSVQPDYEQLVDAFDRQYPEEIEVTQIFRNIDQSQLLIAIQALMLLGGLRPDETKKAALRLTSIKIMAYSMAIARDQENHGPYRQQLTGLVDNWIEQAKDLPKGHGRHWSKTALEHFAGEPELAARLAA